MLVILCVLFLSQGVSGLVHELTDGREGPWGALVTRVDLLDGIEVYASVALLVLGAATGAAAASLRQRRLRNGRAPDRR